MENKESKNVSFGEGVKAMIKGEFERRGGSARSVFLDIIVFFVSFLFARCHIVFGAYPLATSFVAVLPQGVWIALLGAVAGSLTLGKNGIIHAIITLIVVFMRVIISGGERGNGVFKEPLVLRISSVAIGAFVGAAYEILLKAFSFASILYGLAGIMLSCLFTFAFSGIFDGNISFDSFLEGRKNIFDSRGNERTKMGMVFFQLAFLMFVFFISLALEEYNILGINAPYVFATAITLFVARRFGSIRAMAVGFASSLGISGIYSVAFALVGLGAGVLFGVGSVYAVIGGGALLSAWSAYIGGTMGFLSTFPEYVTAALLAFPFIRKLPGASDKNAAAAEDEYLEAEDMVNLTAIAYKNSKGYALDSLEYSLMKLSGIMKEKSRESLPKTKEEYHNTVVESAEKFCKECRYYQDCIKITPAPCAENIDLMTTIIYKNSSLAQSESQLKPQYCKNYQMLTESIMEAVGNLREKKYQNKKTSAFSEIFTLFSRIVAEGRTNVERESAHSPELSSKVTEIFEQEGLCNCCVKVLGERKRYFIGAAEDADGSIISSQRLREKIEEATGVRLGTPEFYRKRDVALLECPTLPLYTVQFACASRCALGEEVCGDNVTSFESEGRFYSLISDGMGTGEQAEEVSRLSVDFLSAILDSGCSKSTALHMLNIMLGARSEECSATVDLFDFDLYSADATFYKCGAAPSYVKRENSIFRIRSETAPVGLMRSIDAERVRVEVRDGDYVIMLSDGISQSAEESAWLIEFLSRPVDSDVNKYAEKILALASERTACSDDMTVAVARISKIAAEDAA